MNSYPRASRNLYAFTVCNYITFMMMTGAPMVLYFKKLGATATIIGLIPAMVHYLNIFQLPAARFVERVGYKKFVLTGFSVRMLIIIIAVGWAFFQDIPDDLRLVGMVGILFFFTIIRGMSICGFMPWITSVIPEEKRGEFLSREVMYMMATMMVMMGVVAAYFHFFNDVQDFAFVFLFGLLASLTSLFFLNRVPDAKVDVESQNRQSIPWLKIVNYPPFRRLLIYNFIACAGLAPGIVFYIPFLRDTQGVSESFVMLINVIFALVALTSLYYFSKIADRTGPRPLLIFSTVLMIFHFLGWGSIASGVVPLNIVSLLVIQTSAGVSIPLFFSSVRNMAMNVIPKMGRSHFFAVFNVATSVTMATAPLLWGMAIDAMRESGWSMRTVFGNGNAYSVLYLGLPVTLALSLIFLHQLKDAPYMRTGEFMREVFVKSFRRIWSPRPIEPPSP